MLDTTRPAQIESALGSGRIDDRCPGSRIDREIARSSRIVRRPCGWGQLVAPGGLTQEIDAEIERFILARGARPSFKGYQGYPASACISVNDVVVHGIPGERKLAEGDIVSIDVGAYLDG